MTGMASLVERHLNGIGRILPGLASRQAYHLLTRPQRRAAVRPEERAVHEQAARSTVPVNGTSVAVYQWGDGTRPVLLLHGYEGRASNFATLVPALLDAGYSAVAYDAFGHGDSDGLTASIPDNALVNRALATRHGTFAGIVGHSIGGTSAFYSLRNGVAAERLATISAWCDFEALFRAFCAYHRLTPAVAAALRRRVERSMLPLTDIWQQLSAVYRPADHAGPLLVVHDEQDREVPVGQARCIADGFGDRARLHLTKGLGHRRILHDADVVTSILDFLAAPASRPPGAAGLAPVPPPTAGGEEG